jgi:hypothetical protein
MADIDLLRALDTEIRTAEEHAIASLAQHMREMLRDLPMESRLCRPLLEASDRLLRLADSRHAARFAGVALRDLELDLRDQMIE